MRNNGIMPKNLKNRNPSTLGQSILQFSGFKEPKDVSKNPAHQDFDRRIG